MGKLSLPRRYVGKYPAQRQSNREKRVIETAINSMRRGTDIRFEIAPICAALDGAGAAVSTTGTTNLMNCDGTMFEYRNIGTQTIVAPVWSSSGLNIARDQAADDGTEVTQGCSANARHAYTVGTDGPFFFELTTTITDVSGTDDYAIGWRKAEAYQAAVDNYDEAAYFNIISGDIKIETILNNAATATVDTTMDWADAESKTLRIEVDLKGKVTFYVNGSVPTVTTPFSFDIGEVVVPFVYLLQDTDLAETTLLTSWKCGLIGR